uniref:Uncharacterized protein n=1 Tax=Sphaeramia orbicularis TaxID=375764 RepID=A0A673APK0_9TELE
NSTTEDKSGPDRSTYTFMTFIRLNDLSGVGTGTGTGAGEDASVSGEESLPYPTLAPVVFFYLKQTTRPRSWCLKMVCNPYPFTEHIGGMCAHAPSPVAGKEHLRGCAAGFPS